MAQRMTIPILIDPSLLHTDRLTLRINGVLQTDRIAPWPQWRAYRGFGFGQGQGTPFGRWNLPGSTVPFGAGLFGQGAARLDHLTLAKFVAGDYSIEVKSEDELGNASSFSAAVTVEHRPKPPAPETLAIAAGELSWTWSDP